MTPNEKLEDLAYNLTCGINALSAIETTMRESADAPDSYLDGLWYICNKLNGCAKAITKAIAGSSDFKSGLEEGAHFKCVP